MSLLGSLSGIYERMARIIPVQPGWIGIDIGSRAIKLAQVVRDGESVRIRARWVLPIERDTALNRDDILDGNLANYLTAIKTLRRMFVGRSCAAVLPTSVVDLRLFEIPSGDANEQRLMVNEELAADLETEPAELAFDYWESANDGNVAAGMSRVTALATPQNVAARLADDLLASGLECHTLNGMPCALARAVEISNPQDADEAVAALDLGYTSAILVIVKAGRPCFTRLLRGGSLQSIMQPLEAGLNLSRDECQQLLVRVGVPAPGQAASAGTRAAVKVIAQPLETLVNEIDRTIAYLGQQFPELRPRRMWLFGGGATIHNLPEHLAKHIQVPTAPWKSNRDSVDTSDAVFGVAAALSSLSWEKRTCT